MGWLAVGDVIEDEVVVVGGSVAWLSVSGSVFGRIGWQGAGWLVYNCC